MIRDPIYDAGGRELTVFKHETGGMPNTLAALTVGSEKCWFTVKPDEAVRWAMEIFAAVTEHQPLGEQKVPDDPGTIEPVDKDLPDWDREQKPTPWKPKPGLAARAIELFLWRLCGTDEDWETALLNYARDIKHDSSPASVWALMEYGCAQLLTDNTKRQTAIGRMRRDLSLLREVILDETGESA